MATGFEMAIPEKLMREELLARHFILGGVPIQEAGALVNETLGENLSAALAQFTEKSKKGAKYASA